jgi:hypothetical protein
MPVHVVETSETIQTIAKTYGFRQWRRIFEHAKNASLRELRPNPDVLARGDQVFVPDLETKLEPARVDEKTVFVLAPVVRELVLSLWEPGGTSLAGVPYELDVEGTAHAGIVDPQGRIRHPIDVDARTATLVLELDDEVTAEIELQIGALEPVDTDEGVRARLYNLGFVHASAESGPPPDLADAMALFRECNGLPALDEPMSATAREDLLFAHGS